MTTSIEIANHLAHTFNKGPKIHSNTPIFYEKGRQMIYGALILKAIPNSIHDKEDYLFYSQNELMSHDQFGPNEGWRNLKEVEMTEQISIWKSKYADFTETTEDDQPSYYLDWSKKVKGGGKKKKNKAKPIIMRTTLTLRNFHMNDDTKYCPVMMALGFLKEGITYIKLTTAELK